MCHVIFCNLAAHQDLLTSEGCSSSNRFRPRCIKTYYEARISPYTYNYDLDPKMLRFANTIELANRHRVMEDFVGKLRKTRSNQRFWMMEHDAILVSLLKQLRQLFKEQVQQKSVSHLLADQMADAARKVTMRKCFLMCPAYRLLDEGQIQKRGRNKIDHQTCFGSGQKTMTFLLCHIEE